MQPYGYTFYNISVLPVAGTGDVTISLGQARGVGTATLRVIDGIRTSPHVMPPMLKLAFDNMRFHVGMALSYLESYFNKGYNTGEPSLRAPEFHEHMKHFVAELEAAKPLWNAWAADFTAQNRESLSGDQFGADGAVPPLGPAPVQVVQGVAPPKPASQTGSALLAATEKEKTLRQYVWFAVAVGAAYLVLR